MFENLKKYLVEELNVAADDVTMEAELAGDLGINSLELADLVFRIKGQSVIFLILAYGGDIDLFGLLRRLLGITVAGAVANAVANAAANARFFGIVHRAAGVVATLGVDSSLKAKRVNIVGHHAHSIGEALGIIGHFAILVAEAEKAIIDINILIAGIF